MSGIISFFFYIHILCTIAHMCFVYVVIEVQIPMEEELITKASIQFPAVTNTSDNDSLVFSSMTPMIEIPSTIILRELEEGECYK